MSSTWLWLLPTSRARHETCVPLSPSICHGSVLPCAALADDARVGALRRSRCGTSSPSRCPSCTRCAAAPALTRDGCPQRAHSLLERWLSLAQSFNRLEWVVLKIAQSSPAKHLRKSHDTDWANEKREWAEAAHRWFCNGVVSRIKPYEYNSASEDRRKAVIQEFHMVLVHLKRAVSDKEPFELVSLCRVPKPRRH